MSKPETDYQMTAAQQIRQIGKIPMVGECSECGKDRAVAFPGNTEFAQDTSGEWVRCPCGQINWLRKLRG